RQRVSFIQCDDVVDQALAIEIEKALTAIDFPWYYYGNVNYGSKPPADRPGVWGQDPRFKDSHGFSSLIFPVNGPPTPWFDYARRILETLLNKQSMRPTQLLRIKANLLVRAAGEALPFTPHVDMPKQHWVVIYYVNDSDGDTLIFDKTFPDWQNAN